MDELKNIDINTTEGGLNTDAAYSSQPGGTCRFALNCIETSSEGDQPYRTNENSTELFSALSQGFIPIGQRYIGNGDTAILSVKEDDSVSEIGILKSSGVYEVHVNDALSIDKDKLKFKVSKQIDIRYRLRQGCQRTIYFTGDDNKPRYYDFDSPEAFKNPDGTWNAHLFNLQRQYSEIPVFSNLEVLDSGGKFKPGGVNIAVQYVDASLNPTEFVVSSPVLKIYNDLTNKVYREVSGSISSSAPYLNYPDTSKAIKVVLDNLDPDFPYYRLAVISSNSGSGQISEIRYTEVIPRTQTTYVLTGDNAPYIGTEQEIAAFTDIIYKAKHIDIDESRLLLSNTKGSPVNFCKLQSYASRITADCYLQEVNLTDINNPYNPKNPSHEFHGIGYMPGEIYSFGIVYVFKGGGLSPVYHIPGKSPQVNPNTVFSPGQDVYPMAMDNECLTKYSDEASCGGNSIWGKDSEGILLKGKPIRHHRFPLRSELGVALVTDEYGAQQTNSYYAVSINIQGDLITPIECDPDDSGCTAQAAYPFSIRVNYTVDGQPYYFTADIDPYTYALGDGTYALDLNTSSQFHGSNNIIITSVEITDLNGLYHSLPDTSYTDLYFSANFAYATSVGTHSYTTQDKKVKTKIFGIKFSGIDCPSLDDTAGEEVIGYYIVRNERTEFDKTILDSGVLTPTIKNKDYISHGLLQPDFSSGKQNYQKDTWGVIHPEHKFNNREYVLYDEMIQQGNYNIKEVKLGKINYDDVYDGTSYMKKRHKDGNDDGHEEDGSPTSRGLDGWSFNAITRDNVVTYQSKNSFVYKASDDDFKNRFYLDALDSRAVDMGDNTEREVFNLAADNKVGIVRLGDENITDNLPYVVFKRYHADPYSTFRVLPYYKVGANMQEFQTTNGNTTIQFGGDTHVTSMRYVNTMFWDNRIAKRAGRSSVLKKVLGAIFIVLGAMLAITGIGGLPGALVVGAGITLAGAGAMFLGSGIKMDSANRAYNMHYEKGLRDTVLDDWVDIFYNYRQNNPFGFKNNTNDHGKAADGPSDDTIQWIGECITDLWFESSVNMALRYKITSGEPSFLETPGKIVSGNDTPIDNWEFFGIHYANSNQLRYPISPLEWHIARKLLVFDADRDDNFYYLGVPLSEWYAINPDYDRSNKQKIFFHLPLEYNCCSACAESFPNRFRYSEQSFQEELVDNFRVFLPNNYRDLSGETGEITNMFLFANNLYLQTKEALWNVPRNYQERITDQVVSFIGTGDYFSIPPVLIMDDVTGNSAGTQHKWSFVKTPIGVFYVSEAQKKLYFFDGKQILPVSVVGLENDMRTLLKVNAEEQYKQATGEDYPYKDNPSNPLGTGFISVYDNVKERVIFTKKDFKYNPDIFSTSDMRLSSKDGDVYVFENYQRTINQFNNNGWDFIGINDDCQMVFERPVDKVEPESRQGAFGKEYNYIDGVIFPNAIEEDYSWTLSYSLKNRWWISYHSYMPRFYTSSPNTLLSHTPDGNIHRHHVKGSFQRFYGVRYPFIIEAVTIPQLNRKDGPSPLTTRIWEAIQFVAKFEKYDNSYGEFVDINSSFFDRLIAYNSRQCTGELTIKIKDQQNPEDYLINQITNHNPSEIIVDRNERNWSINNLRDIRTNYSQPIFDRTMQARQPEYFIDKVLNTGSLNPNKDWTEKELLRDKYLVVRLFFDNFEDVKVLLEYTLGDETLSIR